MTVERVADHGGGARPKAIESGRTGEKETDEKVDNEGTNQGHHPL